MFVHIKRGNYGLSYFPFSRGHKDKFGFVYFPNAGDIA